MDFAALDRAIYERYIVPTKSARTGKAGLEFEFPIVNKKNEPVDFEAAHAMMDAFMRKFSFRETARDDDGFVYSARNEETDDSVSFDCSYNTLEFSFGAELNLHAVSERFTGYYSFVQEELAKYGHALTGMGINPRYAVNRNVPVAGERYRMLYHHLSSYVQYGQAIPFHHYPNFGMFSCASQVQLDVSENDLAETLNTFSKLEPLKALLFSNSLWRESGDVLCARDSLWRNSLHGLNPHNVDMYDLSFGSVGEVLEYIRSMSLYCLIREDRYVNFRPLLLTDYFFRESVDGEYFDGERYRRVRVRPEISDLQYLRSFKFEALTFRGTVEFRSICEQPAKDVMSPAAFHAGLMEVLPALTELLDCDHILYHRGYNASELRRIFVQREWPSLFDRKQISALLLQILDLAEEGLQKRGMGEEIYLKPLYERAEKLTNPALEMLEGLEKGRTVDDYIEEYGRLS